MSDRRELPPWPRLPNPRCCERTPKYGKNYVDAANRRIVMTQWCDIHVPDDVRLEAEARDRATSGGWHQS